MASSKLPPALQAAQQRAAQERGDPLPIDKLDISAALNDVVVGTALATLVEQDKTVEQAEQQHFKLEKEAETALYHYLKQLGYIREPKPKPTYQIKGTITIDHTTHLWGNDRIGLFDFLNRIVGEHKENSQKCWSNQRLNGDVTFGWDKVVDRDKFITFAEGVANQVYERYPNSGIYVTAAIELLL